MSALPSSPPPPSWEDDRSAVRSRPDAEDALERARSARPARIRAKVVHAEALLQSLPHNHPQARLLRIAIVRRDELLIENLIDRISRGGFDRPTGHTGLRSKK